MRNRGLTSAFIHECNSVFRAAMTDPSNKGYWITYRNHSSGPAGEVYSEVSPGPFCPAGNGTIAPPASGWWPGPPRGKGITCGDDWFFDLTNAGAAALFSSNEVLRLDDTRVDGFFYDDTEGLGVEHGALIRSTGLSNAEVAAWNAARLPVYQTVHEKLLAHGQYLELN